ncbi:MAG: response regulator, partial [Magnetospiraceae bacterium]
LVAGVLEILMPRTEGKKIKVSHFIAPDLDRILRGDAGRLRQVLLNLMGNAIKFTEEGSVSVEIFRNGGTDDLPLVRFEVRDTGIGITNALKERLFESFAQEDASFSRRYGGTGLGLAISKRLIEAMGGTIGVDSQVGKGSTFWFQLALPTVANSDAAESEAAFLAGRRILIVDDNAVNREVFALTMDNWGVRTATASSVEQALETVHTALDSGDPFEAVLLDYQMPEKTGEDFIKVLQNDNATKTLPVIVASSVPARHWSSPGLVKRVAGYMLKPVRREALIDTLQRCLSSQEAPADLPLTPEQLVARRPVRAGKLRLLVAEDNSVNQMVARGMLSKLGHRVDVVGNGREALEAVELLPYDLVFMDMQMPEMDGLEAAQAIRGLENEQAHIPIIAMTANALLADKKRCLAAGMNDHLAKPIDHDRLVEILERWAPTDRGGVVCSQTGDPGMPSSTVEIAILNRAGAIRRLDGNKSLYQDLLDHFLEKNRGSLDAITAALQAGDQTAAAHQIHTLKGVTGTIGADLTSHLLADLEQALLNGQPIDALLKFAQNSYTALFAALDQPAGAALQEQAEGNLAEDPGTIDLLGRLQPLIASGDLDSIALATELCSLLEGHPKSTTAAHLLRQIEDFDFEAAAVTLEALKTA